MGPVYKRGREGRVRSQTDTQSHSLSSLTNEREATQECSLVGHDLGHCDVVSGGHDMTKQISPATMPSYVGLLCVQKGRKEGSRSLAEGTYPQPLTAQHAIPV